MPTQTKNSKTAEPAAAGFQMIALALIAPSKLNPRKNFDEGALAELAGSIKEKGVLQPVVVRPMGDSYELVAGERRYRAATMAGQTEIPAMVRELDDKQVLEIMVIENAQRADVHPLEECDAFAKLIKEHDHDVDSIAARIGKTVLYVRGRLILGNLGKTQRAALLDGVLPLGHAQLIARLDPECQDLALGQCDIRALKGGKFEVFNHQGRIPSLHQLRNWIKRDLTLDVADAKWDLEDATLSVEAGPCSTCQKRTGVNQSLFPELESDVCTDRKCWENKKGVWVERKIADGRARGLTLLSGDWNAKKKDIPADALTDGEWYRGQDADPIGIIINGYRAGEEVHFVRAKSGSSGAAAEKREAEAKVEKAYRRMLLDAVRDAVSAGAKMNHNALLRAITKELFVGIQTNSYMTIVARHLGLPIPKNDQNKPAPHKALEDAEFDPLTALTVIAFFKGVDDSWGSFDRINGFAKLVGVDPAAIRREAKKSLDDKAAKSKKSKNSAAETTG